MLSSYSRTIPGVLQNADLLEHREEVIFAPSNIDLLAIVDREQLVDCYGDRGTGRYGTVTRSATVSWPTANYVSKL